MSAEAVDLGRKLSLFTELWSPKVIARVNDYEVKVVKVKGSYNGGQSRFDGFQITIQGKNGQQWYTHLSKANVKAGQTVKKGQALGRSGSANGVPHLHFSTEKGDPRRYVRG